MVKIEATKLGERQMRPAARGYGQVCTSRTQSQNQVDSDPTHPLIPSTVLVPWPGYSYIPPP